MTLRVLVLIAISAASLAAAFLLPAVPQPSEYHLFADHRVMLGMANFLDVVSNLGFLLAALAGLFVVTSPRTCFASKTERWPYAIFFAGMLLTAAGSAYYHLAPDNERLFWDRLPMTVAFMSLVAAQIVDRIDVKAGIGLLLPMLLLGAISVVHWRASERAGHGNVLPYAILQGYSVVVLLLIALLRPSRYTRGNDMLLVFTAYVLAKLFEHFDQEILSMGNLVSGHTLKHLAAAVGGYLVYRMLALRTARDPQWVAASDGVPRPARMASTSPSASSITEK